MSDHEYLLNAPDERCYHARCTCGWVAPLERTTPIRAKADWERHERRWRRDSAEERLAAVRALFSPGPDTSCRTTWRHSPPILQGQTGHWEECVEVPLADLRAVLDGEKGWE